MDESARRPTGTQHRLLYRGTTLQDPARRGIDKPLEAVSVQSHVERQTSPKYTKHRVFADFDPQFRHFVRRIRDVEPDYS